MVLGISLETFTLVHVVLSLVGIASGCAVVVGLLTTNRMDGWTAIFLGTTLATNVTAFGFPSEMLLPSHGVALVSLVVLAAAIAARYGRGMENAWRWIYVVSAVSALYLNVFVLIVQAFLKVPTLTAMAPTQSEPPFLLAQGAALMLFAVLGVVAVARFHPMSRRRF